MAENFNIKWDQVGEKKYESGVDHVVLYPAANGAYPKGVAWNGVTAINENPSGAESNKQYADNIEYLNILSKEQYACNIEAFTYPDEFMECDGTSEVAPGVYIGQQNRKTFGLCYRSLIGNDVDDLDHGYKLHLVYGGKAAPSGKDRGTINESPEAATFSWEVSTTPVEIPGYKPSAKFEINSTKVDAAKLAALEKILYGTAAVDASEGSEAVAAVEARLPLPAEIIAMFAEG